MIRLLALAALLTLPAGCFAPHSHVHGSALDVVSGARALCWPAGAVGDWHCVVDRDDSSIELAEAQRLTEVPEGIYAVIVVLPGSASPELRKSALALIDAFEAEHPGINSHVAVTERSWKQVARGRDVLAMLKSRRQKRPVAERRRDDVAAHMRADAIMPDLVVAPLAGGSGRFAVCDDLRRGGSGRVREVAHEEIRAPEPRVRDWLPRTFRSRVTIAIPLDAPRETRELCYALGRTTLSQGRGAIDVLYLRTSIPQAELVDAASVAARIDDGRLKPRAHTLGELLQW